MPFCFTICHKKRYFADILIFRISSFLFVFLFLPVCFVFPMFLCFYNKRNFISESVAFDSKKIAVRIAKNL